jgi:glycosyltransferase involved in cell wall biosynthesis
VAVGRERDGVSITVVIPTIDERHDQLDRAVASVQAQSLPAEVEIEFDRLRTGAAATRNRALERVDTEWVAFLDDDDEFKPNHLRACARNAALTGADLVYPWFDCDGEDKIGMFGVPFDPVLLRKRNYIPVTVLVRTELVRKVGGFQDHPDDNGDPCEDWGLWLALLDAGAVFSHLPQRTWIWHNGAGTRGRGTANNEG